MEYAITIAIAAAAVMICVLFAAVLQCLSRITETVEDNKVLIAELYSAVKGMRDEIDDIAEPPSKVASPSPQTSKPLYNSTPHIVVPKTPAEIRAENYRKLKEMSENGSVN